METCLKCGYVGKGEEFAVCEKCGAVQDKVRASIADKIKVGLGTCDELASLSVNERKRASELRSFAAKNSNRDIDWKKHYLDPLDEIESALQKIGGQIDQLRNHVSAFTTSYETNAKLAKLGEYLKQFKGEIEKNSLRLDELWTYARNATLNHAAGVMTSDFGPPRGHSVKYEVLEEIETKIHENRYPFMQIIAWIYKALGWLVAVLTVVVVLWSFFSGDMFAPQIIAGALLGGMIACITLFAIAESIKVGIDIEQNTRATREYARGQFMKGISGE